MQEVGKAFGIAQHLAGIQKKSVIIGPADVEIHKGEDKRYYVLDFARFCPPRGKTNFLCDLFRPEFLSYYSKKHSVLLNSDLHSNCVSFFLRLSFIPIYLIFTKKKSCKL